MHLRRQLDVPYSRVKNCAFKDARASGPQDLLYSGFISSSRRQGRVCLNHCLITLITIKCSRVENLFTRSKADVRINSRACPRMETVTTSRTNSRAKKTIAISKCSFEKKKMIILLRIFFKHYLIFFGDALAQT